MGAIFERVIYGDVTRDGAEEALVVVSFVTGGSAIPQCVYDFSVDGGRAHLLWSVLTGDRADGGLKAAEAESGDLVLETYAPEGSRCDCCPVAYRRERYCYSRGQFKRVTRSGLLELPT
jgi:hypothetical protein